VTPIPHLLDAPMAADLDNGHHQDDATYVGQPVNVTCWRQAASVSARHAWSLASFDPNGITHRYPPRLGQSTFIAVQRPYIVNAEVACFATRPSDTAREQPEAELFASQPIATRR
jgi:hypothetical protein